MGCHRSDDHGRRLLLTQATRATCCPLASDSMVIARPAFTVGIEEEYLLVDRESRNLVADPAPGLMGELEDLLGHQVSPEFLRSQIEVGTKVCVNLGEAATDLEMLRRVVCATVRPYGYAIIASSTHPFGIWREQLTTPRERYEGLARDLQAVLRRLVICGMHVHVGIEDPELRIDLMNQITYFVPHLYALSTSSPFWAGENTGMKSYRKSVFKALPRTGLPPEFSSWGEYERHVDALVGPGVIEDGTKLWWDVRPSARYPTLELRIADVCTDINDALTIAGLYLALLSMLYRRRTENQRWRHYASILIDENIWRAQRYGASGSLIDFGLGKLVDFPDLVEELLELVGPDLDELDCRRFVEHARTISARGTSADRQLSVYDDAIAAGASVDEAFRDVVDMLIDLTEKGLTPVP